MWTFGWYHNVEEATLPESSDNVRRDFFICSGVSYCFVLQAVVGCSLEQSRIKIYLGAHGTPLFTSNQAING